MATVIGLALEGSKFDLGRRDKPWELSENSVARIGRLVVSQAFIQGALAGSIPARSFLLSFGAAMAISRLRQKQLRRQALSIIWQVLDGATREIDFHALDREGALSSDDEIDFVVKIIDEAAQRAFNAYEDYKEKLGRSAGPQEK